MDLKVIFISDEEYKNIYDNISGNAAPLIDLLVNMKTFPLDVCIKSILFLQVKIWKL